MRVKIRVRLRVRISVRVKLIRVGEGGLPHDCVLHKL